jgi:hypothetical protein
MFALSLLGQAFLSHVKSDERLAGCSIQLVGIRRSPRHTINAPIFIDGVPGMLIASAGGRLPSRVVQLSLLCVVARTWSGRLIGNLAKRPRFATQH